MTGGDKSTAGNTSAWVAAIRGLGSEAEGPDGDGGEGGQGGHVFLETTYRLPTPCHVCHQILRGEPGELWRAVRGCAVIFHLGHTRQGIKCKICKVNIHHKCQAEVRLNTGCNP